MIKKTVEPQYQMLLKVRKEKGLVQLGLMTNQVWHDDPRRVSFMMSRYKFVSKMFSGRKKVAEAGCGDAFCARIVKQEIGELHVYDFDPLFIKDVKLQMDTSWPLEAYVHNLLDGALPHGPYDGIYSLDVMEHIAQDQEHIYIRNLRDSLAPGGALIIGMPSLESQHHASLQSKKGHVNCKSGKELRKLLEKSFRNVFLFSMNDEVVHTGFSPMAHYLLALCCEPR